MEVKLIHDGEPYIIETDLTDEEKEIIQQGREEYAQGSFIPLHSIL